MPAFLTDDWFANVEKLTAAMIAAGQILADVDESEFAALYKIRI